MIYNEIHVGAVVGQLHVFYRQFMNRDIEAKKWDNVTSYTLSNATGFSRYHVVNILEIAIDAGLVVWVSREHRNNVHKICYKITEQGIKFIRKLLDSGDYRDSVNLIVRNHHMKSVAKVDYEYSMLETMLYIEKGRK